MSSVETVNELLLAIAGRRIAVLKQLSIIVTLVVVGEGGVYLWAALMYEMNSKSSAMFGLFGTCCGLLLGLLVYTVLGAMKTTIGVGSSTRDIQSQRGWHKIGYKLLALLTVFESCLFFGTIPVLGLHSLGLALRLCLQQVPVYGNQYQVWKTVGFQGQFRRVQELSHEEVYTKFSLSQVGMFWAYIGSLCVQLVLTGLLWNGQMHKAAAASVLHDDNSKDVRPRSSSCLSSVKVGQNLLLLMLVNIAIQLVGCLVGILHLGNYLFIVALGFVLASVWPWKNLWIHVTRTARQCSSAATRIQRRTVSSSSYSMLLFALYSTGLGTVIVCFTNVPLYASTGELILPKYMPLQFLLMLVLHVVFTCVAGICIYMHLSVSDHLESVLVVSSGDWLGTQKVRSETTAAPHQVVVDIMVPGQVGPPPMHEIFNPSPYPPNLKMCISCHKELANISYMPCGHTVTCRVCTEFLTTVPDFKCPTCDQGIYDYVQHHYTF